tara:strand:+ start:471 stop:1064 length:594 start_codon:yes stop_codon:yes gene_type:complete
MNPSTFSYKVVLLGDSSVGKSSVAIRFSKNEFSEFQESTIGAAFLTKTINDRKSINPNDKVRFEIWDTAGQERYHSLAPMYYRGAKAAMVVYDITSELSFEKAKEWVNELQQSANENMIISLVGNKTDIEYLRKVEKDKAIEYANQNDLVFLETSAKSGDNITETFNRIADRLPREIETKQTPLISTTSVASKNRCC